MDDRSFVKPILDAIEYFIKSESELQHFYNIVDKFCVIWFGNPISSRNFKNVDLYLIHDLLGEYIRFEENNKRIALWLFAINRVSYNYTSDLSAVKKEVDEISKSIDEKVDISLIEQILNNLKKLEDSHLNTDIKERIKSDVVGNFLQWIGIYTTYIYPSLDNKTNFYDKNIIKAMNYLVFEFIQQKSNDKRLSYLILSIMESCKLYSIQESNNNNVDFMKKQDSEVVIPGEDKNFVEELLNKLKNENEKQRNKPMLYEEITADQIVKEKYDKFINDLNNEPAESVSIFNKHTTVLANNLVMLNPEKYSLFIQTLIKYRKYEVLNVDVYKILKNSVSLLSTSTKNWFNNESINLQNHDENYFEMVIQRIVKEPDSTKTNIAKLFIMFFLLRKYDLI
jgi:hypothetical protein